jgi:hypothetical protein
MKEKLDKILGKNKWSVALNKFMKSWVIVKAVDHNKLEKLQKELRSSGLSDHDLALNDETKELQVRLFGKDDKATEKLMEEKLEKLL